MSDLICYKEIDALAQQVEAFQQGELDEARFVPLRLQQGIYGQRQANVQMLRIKIPAGAINAAQLESVAQVIQCFSARDHAHLTTRQDIQVYDVTMADAPAAMRILAEAGLTTREACGNTVRNITACPLAGVCAHEYTDMRAYVEATMAQLLRHPLTQYLPRKFKISFSGCEADCAQGLIHDLAVIATWQGDQPGFKLLAGGGLGHKPRKAIELEAFIPKERLALSVEALLWVHNRYSNRRLRARSRLKFLVDDLGAEGLIERYQAALMRIQQRMNQSALFPTVDTPWQKASHRPEGFQAHDYTHYPLTLGTRGQQIWPVQVVLGDITALQLQGLAQLMRDFSLDDTRIVQDQNLLLIGVGASDHANIQQRLNALGLMRDMTALSRDIVACPGTESCRLGITHSKGMARRLMVRHHTLRIHIAGCQNGCAQPEIADVGLYGEGKRHHGHLVPFYQTWLGGQGHLGGEFAIKGPSLPVQRIEVFMARIQQAFETNKTANDDFYHWSRRQGSEYFQTMAEDLCAVNAEDVTTLAVDVPEAGQPKSPFKVEQFGGGECAGIADAFIDACLSELAYEKACRSAYLKQGNTVQAVQSLSNALQLCAGGAWLLSGKKLGNDRAQWLLDVLNMTAEQPFVAAIQAFNASLQALLTQADGVAEVAVQGYMKTFEKWLAQTFTKQALDEALLSDDKKTSVKRHAPPDVLDLSEYACPMHYLKARKHLKTLAKGEMQAFLFVSGTPAEEAIESLKKDGHGLISSTVQGKKTWVQMSKDSG